MVRIEIPLVKTTRIRKGRGAGVFPRQKAWELVNQLVSVSSLEECSPILQKLVRRLPSDGYGNTWRRALLDLSEFTRTEEPHWSIFGMSGNSKLPFVTFGTLPVVTCPGHGECKTWCYSFRSWRYARSFSRMIQNTLLLQHRQDLIAEAFLDLPNASIVRLYVDGDFSSVDDVRFWMQLLLRRPDIKAYGYSKSWDELWAYHQEVKGYWPKNYRLNLSSGGTVRQITEKQIQTLPVYRGEFLAVATEWRTAGAEVSRFDDKEYHRSVREEAERLGHKNVFSCPGQCGSCCGGSHACGSDKFKGVTIAIGIH